MKAQLRQPHSIVFDRDGTLLICDIGNQRIRRLHLDTGVIETYAGTGQAADTPDGAPVSGTPLRGPRTMALAPNGDLYLALREGNAILRIDATDADAAPVAGTGEQGYSGDGGPALDAKLGGPKGLAYGARGSCSSPTPRTMSIRRIDLDDRRHHHGARHRRAGATARRPDPLAVQAVASARRARRRVRHAVRRRQRSAPYTDLGVGLRAEG